MIVKIGSARIDENGKAKGGRAGDQTGKEVSTQNWYKHSKSWRVFRAKDPAIAEKIAWDMQAACNNPHIGYDQNQRLTLYNVAKPFDFNCAKVNTNCETDCSALVRVCCAYAGVMLPNFRTTDEAKVLLNSGAFVELSGSKYSDSHKYLCRGDILVTKTQGHTVVTLNNGELASNRTEPINLDKVLVTGKSVCLRAEPDTRAKILGYGHAGDRYQYIETSDNWYKVNSKYGDVWVSGKYSVMTN